MIWLGEIPAESDGWGQAQEPTICIFFPVREDFFQKLQRSSEGEEEKE